MKTQAIFYCYCSLNYFCDATFFPSEQQQKNRIGFFFNLRLLRLVHLRRRTHNLEPSPKRMASMLQQVLYPVLGLVLMTIHLEVSSLAITNGHCQKNISVKYQVPVAKNRMAGPNASHPVDLDSYVVYEERVRWDNIQVCCPGYRTILFGFCEPVCQEACPAHSYCAEPDRCHCQRGYEPSHHHTTGHQLVCRPVCQGGCPEHSHCVAHNECECWPGFKDASSWFSLSLRCERVQCGHEQRFDPGRRACVQIEMSMEELMQRVAERLAKGLGAEEEAVNEPES